MSPALPTQPATADHRLQDPEAGLQTVRRQARRETTIAAVLWLLLALLLVLHHQRETARALAEEGERLTSSTRMIELNVVQQLQTAHAALRTLRDDLSHQPVPLAYVEAQLRTLRSAWPGAVRIEWLAGDGRVLGSSDPDRVGVEESSSSLLRKAADADPQALLAGPRSLRDGEVQPGLMIGLPMPRVAAPAGTGTGGVLKLELGGPFFDPLLQSANDRSAMWSALAHRSGTVLALDPPQAQARRTDLARPGTWFSSHLASGQALTLRSGQPALLAQPQLLVQRTLQLPGLQPDDGLVIGVSRELQAILAPVRQRLLLLATLLGLAGVALALGLRALHRAQAAAAASQAREAAQAQAQAAQALAQAEFLDLALRGGDLGLWESDLRTGKGRSSDRWYQMVGLQPGEVEASSAQWAAMIHPEDRERVVAAQAAHIRGETPAFEQRYRLRHKAGHYIWVLDRARVVERDAAGQPLVMAGTHLDITEAIAVEQALRENMQSLAVTLQSIGDAVIATDAQGRITRLNPTAERLLGWSLAEALGQPLREVFQIFNARTREPVADPVQQVLQSGQVVGLANDTLLRARDGNERQIADSAAPIRTADGQVLGVVLVFSDVTEQYRVLQALREREHELSMISDAIPGPVIRAAADGRILFVNRAAELWRGLPRAELMKLRLADMLGGEQDLEAIRPQLERVQAGQVVQFDRALDTAQGVRSVSVTLVPDWSPTAAGDGQAASVQGHFAIITDISQRKAAEDALRLSERKAVSLLAALRSGVVVHGADTAVLDANPAACGLLGLSLDQMRGVTAIDPRWHFVEADGQPMPMARYPANQVHADGRVVNNLVVGIQRPDRDQPVWGLCNAFPLLDEQGQLREIVVTIHDITERYLAERQLQALQAELAATLDAVPDLLFEIDRRGVIHGHHSPRQDLLAVPPEVFLGQPVERFLPAAAWATVQQALAEAARDGWAAGHQYELPLAAGPHWFELSVATKPGASGDEQRFIVLARDITERRQAETERRALELQLREAQKMESIGTLAGGIAHDFNNILAAILGNVALARDDLVAGHPARASLDQIQKASLRARTLVQQILAFSRRQPQQLTVQPLQPVFEETLELLRATLPAGVQLSARLHPNPLQVRADATQLQQVLMNLCTNAWQSLPANQGAIEVGLEPAEGPAGPDEAAAAGPGTWAHLWVRDNGKGIDPTVRDRIFDPFFTTKPVGQGTGLGLSVVHGIVRAHGGSIQVDSVPGQGSTFHVWLPLATAERAAPDAAGRGPVGKPGVQGPPSAVLYVDDDEVMVLMVQRLLERDGWQVDTCTSASEALARVEPARYAAVVTDFNMPGMSGLELARALRERAPDVPVIISSGYISDELRAQARRLGVGALMKKENTLEELPRLLARVIGARAQPPGD